MKRRIVSVLAAASTLTAAVTLGTTIPQAAAVDIPGIDPAALPPPSTPGPEQTMKQTARCISPITVDQPDIKLPAPGFAMLNVDQAWKFSTGAGVTVGVIDTGVTPNPRLPRVYAGGDYVTGQADGGLDDCEGHGTAVASIIAGQPFDPATKPPSRPENAPALPPPPPPPGPGAPVTPPPEPPKPVTVTVVTPPPAPPPPPPPENPPAAHHRVLPQQWPVYPAAGNGPRPLEPAPPPPPGPPPPGDAFVGVAPDVAIISMRQSSEGFSPEHAGYDPDGRIRKAGDLMTLARAIRRMADLGARVINLSVQSCMNANDLINDAAVGAALNYAVVDKDAVVVAAAGNTGEPGCGQNPLFDPLRADDPRDWHQVSTVVSPAWYGGADLVLTVGGVDAGPAAAGAPLKESIAGPWVQVAAPSTPIIAVANKPDGQVVNAHPDPQKPGETIPLWGTSYAAPFVSGVAALVRARFPQLTAHQVMRRITETAHNPPGGVDNKIGYGVIDPVLALTADVDPGPRLPVPHLGIRIPRPAPPPVIDHTPRNAALMCAGLVVLVAAATITTASLRRHRR